MRKDLALIIKECSDLGIKATINTNCTLLSNKVATVLLNAGISGVSFSLDGITSSINDSIRGKGTFKTSVKNISNFTKLVDENGYNCITNISYTLTKYSISNPTEILNFFSELGIDFLSFGHLNIKGNASKNRDNLLIGPFEEFDFMENILSISDQYTPLQVRFEFKPKIIEYFKLAHNLSIDMEYNGCKATVAEFYMQPDGALFPCQAITENKKIFDILNFKYMSLKNLSFRVIYNSNHFNEFGIKKNNPGYLNNYDPCFKCKYAYKICNPCPIPYFEGKSTTFTMCKIVDDRIHKLKTF